MTVALFLLFAVAVAEMAVIAYLAHMIGAVTKAHAAERARILDAIMALQTGGPAGNFASLSQIASNKVRIEEPALEDLPMPAFAGFGDG